MKHPITFSLLGTCTHRRISSSPKSMLRMTEKVGYVILNAMKNPAHAWDESKMKHPLR